MKYLCLIALVALTACGGSSNHTPAVTMPPEVTPPPMTLVDAFVTAVLALIGDSSDTKEPVSIDAIAVTAPEDSEPVAVK
jgi:hypothetical protein